MANTKFQLKRKYHIIYETKNLINGMIYVGAHSTDLLDDGYLGSGTNIIRAINKYGVSAFERKIHYIYESPAEMFSKEKEIVTPEFLKRSDVYNIVEGGYGGVNKGTTGLKHMHLPGTRERIAIHPNAIQKMLCEGWVMGAGMSSTAGTKWINRGEEKKMVSIEELSSYLERGWSKGLPKSPTSGKTWIYHVPTDKYSLCEKENLEARIKEGWIKQKWAPRGPNKYKK